MSASKFRGKLLVAALSWLWPLSAPLFGAEERAQPAPGQDFHADYVVLLHGLGRTGFSMKRLEWLLSERGYRVINVSYPSTRMSVQAAGAWLADLLCDRALDQTVKIHFVTHSLGGIVLRQYLLEHRLDNLGRIVMLAPPNQGSELVDRLRASLLFQLCTGPAGQQLGTDTPNSPACLGTGTFDTGVIAGDRSLNPLFSYWIPGPDDGKVSVASTRMAGLRDFIVVHHSHTWMMWRMDVLSSVLQFLKTGRFACPETVPCS